MLAFLSNTQVAVTVNGYFTVSRVVFGLKDTEGIKVEKCFVLIVNLTREGEDRDV